MPIDRNELVGADPHRLARDRQQAWARSPRSTCRSPSARRPAGLEHTAALPQYGSIGPLLTVLPTRLPRPARKQWVAACPQARESLSTSGNPCHTDARVLPANQAGEASGNSRVHGHSLFALSGLSGRTGRGAIVPEVPKGPAAPLVGAFGTFGTARPRACSRVACLQTKPHAPLHHALAAGPARSTAVIINDFGASCLGAMATYEWMQLLFRKALNCLDAGAIPWLHVCVT